MKSAAASQPRANLFFPSPSFSNAHLATAKQPQEVEESWQLKRQTGAREAEDSDFEGQHEGEAPFLEQPTQPSETKI
jgi:hypothetical protein